jgi:hypothetical protein
LETKNGGDVLVQSLGVILKSSMGRRVNVPKLYAVHAQDICESVLVCKEKPVLCESWSGKRHVWFVKEQLEEWCHMFPLPE